MKANYIALSAAAITLTLASCSNDELESLTNSPQNAIGFSAVNNHVSRATPITSANSMEKFNVYAFTTTGNKPFMGTADNDFGTSGGITIKNGNYNTENTANWTYDNLGDIHYWPTDALNFYAVSPISAATELGYKWKFTGTSNEITYTCSDEYENDATAKNVDVMYAIAKNQSKPTDGKVNLHFHHILSQVVFSAKTEYTNMKVEINSIKIKNLKNSGTFTLPEDGAAGSGTWDITGAETYNPTVTKTPIVISTTTSGATTPETKEITSATNNPLMVIPQKPTAWVPSNTTVIADSQQQTYLEISCKISQNGVYIFGGDEYETIYVPFGGDKCDWKPGKRYIYTLIFGGGYDANGNAVLTPINFTADVESWDGSNTIEEDLPLKP